MMPPLRCQGGLLLLLLGSSICSQGAGIGLDGGYTDIVVHVNDGLCTPGHCTPLLRKLKVTASEHDSDRASGNKK
jgi:hypothetical protein